MASKSKGDLVLTADTYKMSFRKNRILPTLVAQTQMIILGRATRIDGDLVKHTF